MKRGAQVALGLVFLLAFGGKLFAPAALVGEIEALGLPLPEVMAAVVLLVEAFCAASALFAVVPAATRIVSSGIVVAFMGLTVVRWDAFAGGCQCFGAIALLNGRASHVGVLVCMAALWFLGYWRLPQESHAAGERRRILLVTMIVATGLTLVAVCQPPYQDLRLTGVQVIALGDDRRQHESLTLDHPLLYVGWDCSHCIDVVSTLLDGEKPTSTNELVLVAVFPHDTPFDVRQTRTANAILDLGLDRFPRIRVVLDTPDRGFTLRNLPTLVWADAEGSKISTKVTPALVRKALAGDG